jgi:hypothetical protein
VSSYFDSKFATSVSCLKFSIILNAIDGKFVFWKCEQGGETTSKYCIGLESLLQGI